MDNVGKQCQPIIALCMLELLVPHFAGMKLHAVHFQADVHAVPELLGRIQI